MPGPPDILNLSIAVQVALGGGYVAYLIAYSGLRQHHSATDVIFRTLAFGLIASAVIAWTPVIDPVKLPLAVAAAATIGASWRWKGMSLSKTVLRRSDVTWSDDIPTAWLSISATRTDCKISQVAVELKDGRILFCRDTRQFSDAPFGPCVLGLAGDIALYVTDELRVGGEWHEPKNVRDPSEGANLTYVPASEIGRVELRFWTKKLNGSDAVEVVLESGEEAEPEAT